MSNNIIFHHLGLQEKENERRGIMQWIVRFIDQASKTTIIDSQHTSTINYTFSKSIHLFAPSQKLKNQLTRKMNLSRKALAAKKRNTKQKATAKWETSGTPLAVQNDSIRELRSNEASTDGERRDWNVQCRRSNEAVAEEKANAIWQYWKAVGNLAQLKGEV